MSSKEANRSLVSPQHEEQQARRSRVESWLSGAFVAVTIAMAAGSAIYMVSTADSPFHQFVDALWARFNYFGGTYPTR